MAKETMREQLKRLEDENKSLTDNFNDCLAENQQLQKKLNAKIEDTEEYKRCAKQVQEMEQQRNTAMGQREHYHAKVRQLESERESLKQQLAELQATYEAQSTAESVPDAQATEVPEAAQNGTQGDTEAVEKPLPENISDKIRAKLLQDQLKYITEQLQESQRENVSLTERYNMLQTQYNNLQLTPLIAGTGNIDLITEQFIEREKELQSEIDELKKENEKANQRVVDFKSKDYGIDLLNRMIKKSDNLSQSLKDKQSALEAAEMAQNTLKSDLEAAQAELQALKQEVNKSSKNPFRAGRKPKLTAEQVEQIKALSNDGLSYRQISGKVGVSPATIMRYLKKDLMLF